MELPWLGCRRSDRRELPASGSTTYVEPSLVSVGVVVGSELS